MNKKYDYYKLEAGFFPNVLKLCFSDAAFQLVLKDHNIPLKAVALDTGVAETHSIGGGRSEIIILVFNIEEIGTSMEAIFDTIAHEVSHAVDNLSELIGETDGIKGETRAYLTGSLVAQVFRCYEYEKEQRARKTDRSPTKQTGKRIKGSELQVGKLSVGSTRSDSIPKQTDTLSRAQDSDRTGF